MEEKKEKMTLKRYYEELPSKSAPKTDFVNEIAFKCCVSVATVHNWISYGRKPLNPDHVKVLVEVTGINEQDLW